MLFSIFQNAWETHVVPKIVGHGHGGRMKSRSIAEKPESDTEVKEDECHGGGRKSSTHDELRSKTTKIYLPPYVPEFTSGVGGEVVVVGLHPETHSPSFRYTPTITTTVIIFTTPTLTQTVSTSTSSQAADTTSTEQSTTCESTTTTSESSTSTSESSTSASESSTSTEESATSEATTTTSESSTSTEATATTSESSTSTTESTSTTTIPSATFAIPDFVNEFTSVYEEESWNGKHSPTGLPIPFASTYIEPTGGVSVIPVNGPTIFMNPSGSVSMWRDGTASTQSASATTHEPSTVTIENGPTVSVDATGGVSVLTAASLMPRDIQYTMSGCTLASQSFKTVTPAGPSTMLRLRRSPGHYEGIDQATQIRAAVRSQETSRGTKDSSNVVYDEKSAATPNNPWGATRHAGKVFTEPKDFAGEASGRLIGIVIGGVFGLVFLVALVWFVFKKVQRRRALAKGLSIKGEMEQR